MRMEIRFINLKMNEFVYVCGLFSNHNDKNNAHTCLIESGIPVVVEYLFSMWMRMSPAHCQQCLFPIVACLLMPDVNKPYLKIKLSSMECIRMYNVHANQDMLSVGKS